MTTEEDFQRQLDADPSDWQTRLVFADWLDEHNDPRGPGYRALGEGRYHTITDNSSSGMWHQYYHGTVEGGERPDTLPMAWYLRFPGGCATFVWKGTRRDADDSAALAFSKA